jgi:hypothetical protein
LRVEAYIEELAELVSKFASGAGGIRLALAMMPLEERQAAIR